MSIRIKHLLCNVVILCLQDERTERLTLMQVESLTLSEAPRLGSVAVIQGCRASLLVEEAQSLVCFAFLAVYDFRVVQL